MRNRLGRRALAIGTALAFVCAVLPPPVLAVHLEGPPVSTLEQVLRSTIENHESLRIAGEAIEQAVSRKKRFLMSLTPDISFLGYSRRVEGEGSLGNQEPGAGQGDNSVFLPEGTFYGYSFSLTQPIYSGGRALAAYRGAGEQVSSTAIQQELVQRDLLVEAAEAYYVVLAAMETVRIGEQAVVRARRHLELAQKRLELGEGIITDRLRAEVNLAQVESDLVRFHRAFADARDLVQRLCGRSLADRPSSVDWLPDIAGPLEDFVSESLERRLEREQDRHRVRIAEEDVREKKGRFLPALFLSASYFGNGEDIDGQVSGWDAGVFLTFPIYERASRFYLLRESRSVLRQTKLRDEGRAKDIALEVSRLYNALQASSANIGTFRKQVELAKENLRLAEKRFTVGLADSIETVDTQTALLEAEVNLTAERLRNETAKLRFVKALGRDVFPGIASPPLSPAMR